MCERGKLLTYMAETMIETPETKKELPNTMEKGNSLSRRQEQRLKKLLSPTTHFVALRDWKLVQPKPWVKLAHLQAVDQELLHSQLDLNGLSLPKRWNWKIKAVCQGPTTNKSDTATA
eukprot:scaffold5771_cov171-Amphora_coffeaeformis.AAC.31